MFFGFDLSFVNFDAAYSTVIPVCMWFVSVCVCAPVYVYARVGVCVCARMHACVTQMIVYLDETNGE